MAAVLFRQVVYGFLDIAPLPSIVRRLPGKKKARKILSQLFEIVVDRGTTSRLTRRKRLYFLGSEENT